MNKYHSAIAAARVIEELIAIAKEMREAQRRGEQLGLSEDEAGLYLMNVYPSAICAHCSHR